MAMVQFIVDDVFERTEGIVIDDKPDGIQRFRCEDKFRDVVVPMQSAAWVPIWNSFYDMAGAEVELFGYRVHEVLILRINVYFRVSS